MRPDKIREGAVYAGADQSHGTAEATNIINGTVYLILRDQRGGVTGSSLEIVEDFAAWAMREVPQSPEGARDGE